MSHLPRCRSLSVVTRERLGKLAIILGAVGMIGGFLGLIGVLLDAEWSGIMPAIGAMVCGSSIILAGRSLVSEAPRR